MATNFPSFTVNTVLGKTVPNGGYVKRVHTDHSTGRYIVEVHYPEKAVTEEWIVYPDGSTEVTSATQHNPIVSMHTHLSSNWGVPTASVLSEQFENLYECVSPTEEEPPRLPCTPESIGLSKFFVQLVKMSAELDKNKGVARITSGKAGNYLSNFVTLRDPSD